MQTKITKYQVNSFKKKQFLDENLLDKAQIDFALRFGILIFQFGEVIPHLKAFGLLIWINSMTLRHDMGHSVNGTV